MINELLYKLEINNCLNKKELVSLLKNMTGDEKELLFRLASDTRDRVWGKRVFMRGLIEFSSICSRNCMYCGLRASNPSAGRYRLMKGQILECCAEGYRLGYRTFVLQSGEDSWFTVDRMIGIISSIKEGFPDTAITLSIGERSRNEYEAMFKAGADRYLLRHETASRQLYEKLHPGMNFHRRRECLEDLKEIGYQVGAGFMVGLPGQTENDLAEDLLYLKELNPHMIGIGPFIPHSETPLKNEKSGTVEETLVLIAIARLMIPDALMPATTAMGTLEPNGRELALKAGANVVMPNLTPVEERPKYALYENKICLGDEAAHCRHCIEQRQQSPISLGGGFPIEKAVSGEIQSPTDVVQSPRENGARRCNLRELMPDSFRHKRLTKFEERINSAGLEVDMGIGNSLRMAKKVRNEQHPFTLYQPCQSEIL